jgi:TonB family protein
MREAVSEILAERAQVAGGVSRMVLLSLIAHGVLLSTMVFLPDLWKISTTANQKVIEISLGGVEGPETGGMTPPSARKVDAVAERERLARPDAPPPPKPEMVESTPTNKPAAKPTTAKPVETKPKETGRKPAVGAEVSKGTARVETNSPAQVPFGGLSTGGGGFGGTEVKVEGFCCREYLETMLTMIRENWKRNQGVSGRVIVSYTVQRDGRITDIKIDQSGGQFLDLVSQRALVSTRQLPPLPREHSGTLTVQLIFEYLR